MTVVKVAPSKALQTVARTPPPPLDDAQKEFRKLLQDCETKGWARFDDLVFKVSAGGLALSMTLLGLLRDSDPAGVVWMFGAWLFWGATLLVLVISVWTGQYGLRSQIAHLDAGTYYHVKRPQGRFGVLTERLNHATIVCCGLGLLCMLVFAVLNLSGGRSMTRTTSTGELRTGGQVAPQAPQAPIQTTQMTGVDQRGQVSPQAPAPASNTVTLPGGAGQIAPQAPSATTTPTAQVSPQAPAPTSNTVTLPGGAGQVAPQAPPALTPSPSTPAPTPQK